MGPGPRGRLYRRPARAEQPAATAILHGLARRTAPQSQPRRSGSRASRWANATGGGNRMDHPAELQDGDEVTVTAASKALNVGERGIYDGKGFTPRHPRGDCRPCGFRGAFTLPRVKLGDWAPTSATCFGGCGLPPPARKSGLSANARQAGTVRRAARRACVAGAYS